MSSAPVRTPLEREIDLPTRLLFGVGQVAEGIKSYAFSLFVLFYYNSVLGLSGSLCGAAIGIALVFDAVTDPLVGSLSDNARTRYGRRHPFMIVAAAPLGLAFFGLFSPPAFGPMGLFLWLTFFAIAVRTAMTFFHVPHTALGAELSSHFVERTRLVATRQAFGYVGVFIVALAGFGIFFADERGGRANTDAYGPFGLAMAVIMIVAMIVSAWGTRRQIPFLPVVDSTPAGGVRGTFRRVFRESGGAFSSRSFRHLFAGTLMIYVMVGTETALALYMYEYFWALGANEILTLSLLYPVGLILGAFLTQKLHERWDKSPTLIFGTAGWCLCQLLPVFGRLLGWMPENGTTALLWTLLVVRLIQGAVVQQALVSFSSMVGDVADEYELVSGRRQEGIFFGVVSFSGKAASGAGTFIAGVALDAISWPAGAATLGLAALPAETIRSLGVVYGPVVALFALGALFFYRGYDLDRARHREVLAALAARRPDPLDEGVWAESGSGDS